MVVDYPNSNKARKVFLCLFVGGGGSAQQVPKGLEAEEEDGQSHARFEASRQRQRKREKNSKRKGIKDRDWILRKKEVCAPLERGIQTLININLTAISAPRQRGCSQRLQIHRSQAEGSILSFENPVCICVLMWIVISLDGGNCCSDIRLRDHLLPSDVRTLGCPVLLTAVCPTDMDLRLHSRGVCRVLAGSCSSRRCLLVYRGELYRILL